MYWVAESEIIEEKADKAIFRIHFRKGEDLKHYDFEAPRSIAGTILLPFSVILMKLFACFVSGFSFLFCCIVFILCH